jgi:hypothetical protein
MTKYIVAPYRRRNHIVIIQTPNKVVHISHSGTHVITNEVLRPFFVEITKYLSS